ncbi:transposase [Sphingobium sp. LMC3-1-1.1]
MTATALTAAVRDVRIFHSGRQFAAGVGLVPNSTLQAGTDGA